MSSLPTCPNGHPLASTDLPCPLCGATVRDAWIPPPSEPLLPAIPGYLILNELGRGGIGVVYKAQQASPSRLVALKVLQNGVFAGPEERARFKAEAEAVARVQHPNIVPIFEVGEREGWLYFTMEYVSGGSLDRKLKGKPQPLREAARLVETLARATHAVHLTGVVHRDLKPANVLIVDSDWQSAETPVRDTTRTAESSILKIADFGLAKRLQPDADQPATASGAILGTPPYMSPEQASGKNKEIGPATDVYALGAILYELLTGRPPFLADTSLETILLVLSSDPVPPSRLRSKVPRDLETICLKCLQKAPQQRYASAAVLAEDLRRYQAGETIIARPPGTVLRVARWLKRNPTRAVALTCGLLIVLVLLVAVRAELGRRREQTRQRENVKRGVEAEDSKVDLLIDEGKFLDAATTLRDAVVRLDGSDDPDLVALHKRLEARRDRLERVGLFYEGSNKSLFLAGEERYPEAVAGIETGLRHLKIMSIEGTFAAADWWNRLPSDDLRTEQLPRLKQDVYAQLLLLVQMRSMSYMNPQKLASEEAGKVFGDAWNALQQAQALEQAMSSRPAQTVRIFHKILRLLAVASKHPEVVPPVSDEPGRNGPAEPSNPADYFFSGSVHYFIGKSPPGDRTLLLLRFALSNDVDFQTPLATAERMLREAIRQDSRQFWASFMLGRTLSVRGDFRGAALAFNTCVAVNPDYPVSYQLRALAFGSQALALDRERVLALMGVQVAPLGYGPLLIVGALVEDAASTRSRRQLLDQAHADAETARQVAERTKESAVYWTRGQFFALLGEVDDALEAYAVGLEREDKLLEQVSRSSVVVQVDKYARRAISRDETNAKAHLVLALLQLKRAQAEPDSKKRDELLREAEQEAGEALHGPSDRTRAQAVLDGVERVRNGAGSSR